MTLDKFILLTEDQRISILWSEAKIIAERKERGYNVFLYQVYSFYIEVWHSCNVMNNYKLRSFSSIDELDPYLEQIDIAEILQ